MQNLKKIKIWVFEKIGIKVGQIHGSDKCAVQAWPLDDLQMTFDPKGQISPSEVKKLDESLLGIYGNKLFNVYFLNYKRPNFMKFALYFLPFLAHLAP